MLEGEKVAKNRKLKEVLCVVFRSLKKTRKSVCTLFTTVCNFFSCSPSNTQLPNYHTTIIQSYHFQTIILSSYQNHTILETYIFVFCRRRRRPNKKKQEEEERMMLIMDGVNKSVFFFSLFCESLLLRFLSTNFFFTRSFFALFSTTRENSTISGCVFARRRHTKRAKEGVYLSLKVA